MSKLVWGIMVSLGLIASLVGAPVQAQASETVVVLGIHSLDGDDELARNITGALRFRAGQVDDWQLSEREVTFSQMSLAYGCDPPETACLTEIAEALEADHLIFGEVRRTSTSEQYDYALEINFFTRDNGQIERSASVPIPRFQSDIDHLREPARRWVARLSNAPALGRLLIQMNVGAGEVYVDGEDAGAADQNGRLIIENLNPGQHRVRISAPGRQGFSSNVNVNAYEDTTFDVELHATEETPLDTDLVVGASLLAGAAGLTAAWIGSWAHVQFTLQEDPSYTTWRRTVGASDQHEGRDVCEVAQRQDLGAPLARNAALQVCQEADTFELLTIAFGAGAAIAGGLGLYFLITALSGEENGEEGDENALRLMPSVGPQHVYLGASLSF